VEIKNSFSVPLPPDDAWRGLLEVPRIAPCMPGARLKETLEDGRYKGEVAVRLGPVMLNFAGKAEIVEQDPAARKARVRAEGSDAKGRGGAQADVHFALEPDGAATRVTILTNLTLTGSVAQYGRGAGMINDLASHMVGQFAANLRRELERSELSVQPAVQDAGAAPALKPADETRPAAADRPAAPIDGGSLGLWLVWRALARFLRRLFGSPA